MTNTTYLIQAIEVQEQLFIASLFIDLVFLLILHSIGQRAHPHHIDFSD